MSTRTGCRFLVVCLSTMLFARGVHGAEGGTKPMNTIATELPGSCLGPSPESNLNMDAPIERWDEAIPLGNGLLGGLVWGQEHKLRLSLDRGDLWDLRRPDMVLRPDWNYATIQRLVAEKNQAELVKMFDDPYGQPYPTKLPVGRLELGLAEDQTVERFSLDLKCAVAHVKLSHGEVAAFFSATQPVALIRIAGPRPQCTIVASTAVEKLGYSKAQQGNDGDVTWSIQDAAQGLKYAVVIACRHERDETQIALTVSATSDGPDPLAIGRKRVADALAAGFDGLLASHVDWWRAFWSQSGVRLPDKAIQRQYDLIQYFHGAASRRGAPPMPLQGVWTADEGALPPWKGDYHHDLNTQLTYWAYLAAGHFEEGACFLDFMWDLLPEHRKFARDFYGAPGAAVPGVMTLDGKATGGWGQYSLSPANGAWVAQAFYLHWRYTMDRKFLADRAYPYLAALGDCFESLLKPGPDGKLKLPLSTSPEIHDNTLRAWLTPNTNFDLALLRWHFAALAEMAKELNDEAAVIRWQGLLDRLDGLAVEGDAGALRLSPDESLAESHRHHSHLMSIHPLGLITIEGPDRDRKIIEASLKQIEELGTRNWCGYSFSWMACIAARAGRPDVALRNLDIFVNAFTSRNGFHLNGDQRGGQYSNFTYRPFTLEGNFAAAQAVHEMLLQSWGSVIRIFPATPAAWQNIAFEDLRAEGGFAVSAQRSAGKTVQVRIRANQDGLLRLHDPFPGRKTTWNKPIVPMADQTCECPLKAGEILEGHTTSGAA